MKQRYSNPQREERRVARVARARKWALFFGIGLIGCSLSAIWQEPALSPKIHAGLKHVAAQSVKMLDDSEAAQSYLTALGGAGEAAPEN